MHQSRCSWHLWGTWSTWVRCQNNVGFTHYKERPGDGFCMFMRSINIAESGWWPWHCSCQCWRGKVCFQGIFNFLGSIYIYMYHIYIYIYIYSIYIYIIYIFYIYIYYIYVCVCVCIWYRVPLPRPTFPANLVVFAVFFKTFSTLQFKAFSGDQELHFLQVLWESWILDQLVKNAIGMHSSPNPRAQDSRFKIPKKNLNPRG